MLSVNGPHPPTLFSVLFPQAVRNISRRFTINLEVPNWGLIHSGMFTINCAMQLTRNFCSGPSGLAVRSRETTRTHPTRSPSIWILINCRFIIFSPVNSAEMEFQTCSLAVKKNQVWCLRNRAKTCPHIYLENNLAVEFTDDEGDEIF
jgi:hypothetical protein